MNNILETLSTYENLLSIILNFIKNNSFIWAYFCYTIGIILTTFALRLITNSIKNNKPSTMIIALFAKLSIFILLKIIEDSLTH